MPKPVPGMKPKPLQIGNLIIDPPILLAPMSGYTKAPFRAICQRYHCGLVFTEAEETCVVYGMPRSVVEAGLSDQCVPLGNIAQAILKVV